MEVRVCKNCKRLFNYIYGPELCQQCIKLVPKDDKERIDKKLNAALKPMVREDEEKYVQVKDYIMAHPKATIVEISEANEVAPTKLLEWVRDDRLEFSEDSKDAWFECTNCGAKIKSGRFCNKCKIRF